MGQLKLALFPSKIMRILRAFAVTGEKGHNGLPSYTGCICALSKVYPTMPINGNTSVITEKLDNILCH